MSDTIKTHFCDFPNSGDQLNRLIIKELWGKTIVYSKSTHCELLGIGSILDFICRLPDKNLSGKLWSRLRRVLASDAPCHVWSSGFMCYNNILPIEFIRKNVVFRAVRGKLSKALAGGIIGAPVSCSVFGDGGLLSSLILKKIEKKYPLSIVPHWREMSDVQILKLLENYRNAHLVDIRKDPMEVISEIASSDAVLSSSLHGLVIADSFNIPNRHVIVSKEIQTIQKFKYADYYSAFDLPHEPVDILSGDSCPDFNGIIDNYKVSYTSVKEKQNQLILAFPFPER